ncbi:MAG: hypothetical protein ACRDGM_15560, partial [bacterium]
MPPNRPLRIAVLSIALAGCGKSEQPFPGDTAAAVSDTGLQARDTTSAPNTMAPLELTSSAFAPNGAIPSRYTCEGDDISPPLQWSDAPGGTRSF